MNWRSVNAKKFLFFSRLTALLIPVTKRMVSTTMTTGTTMMMTTTMTLTLMGRKMMKGSKKILLGVRMTYLMKTPGNPWLSRISRI